ncbi:hypothetical protein [uncultured Jatrophihabitans sp.]|uniref:hypothetical protein n=1 Tax=uncultured Jatrophihabitans sp. TaxID=1610747 RepID=UPI0035C9E8A5
MTVSPAGADLRRRWLAATVLLTLTPFVAAVLLAPAGSAAPSVALVWLLFVGSSAHVGATAWFYCVPEVRAHMRAHRLRYQLAPVGLVVAATIASIVASASALIWGLLAYFAWQFFHFQKQNLGIAALAARANGAGRLSHWERFALTGVGVGGVCALVGHPALLQLAPQHRATLLFGVGAVIFAASVLLGAACLARRQRSTRPGQFVIVYLISLLFFLPVFCFSSPYAAVAGLTMAHGLQYLLLMGLLARVPSGGQSGRVGVLILVNIALVLGLALNQASHLHGGGPVERAIFGVYLGAVMAHFVIDAGLWRLRDEFPRRFLTQRLPFLLAAV